MNVFTGIEDDSSGASLNSEDIWVQVLEQHHGLAVAKVGGVFLLELVGPLLIGVVEKLVWGMTHRVR